MHAIYELIDRPANVSSESTVLIALTAINDEL